MNTLKLAIRGAAFRLRTHIGIAAASALSVGILVGALLVGDSAKHSLKTSALLRLGGIRHAVETRGRFFGEALADRLSAETGTAVAPVLALRGMAIRPARDGEAETQVNNVAILGVDGRFRQFGGPSGPAPSRGEVVLNRALARELDARPGDRLSVRVRKPPLLSGDAPLSSREAGDTVRASLTVAAVAPDAALGAFGLNANQAVPYNAFVNMEWLRETISLKDKANILLAGGDDESPDRLNKAMTTALRMEDAGLRFREFDDGSVLQIESERIFMEPGLAQAALQPELTREDGAAPVGTLTYLVNGISVRRGDSSASVPYSFVQAASPSPDRMLSVVPAGMKDDEIIINRMLANSLDAKPGETVELTYFELAPMNRFVEKTRAFHVRGTVEMDEISREREMSPLFPGLTDADRCAEWDIGMPLDAEKIRDEANERYWNEHRTTPKAFVTLQAGRQMWAGRFGDLSSVRYRAGREDAHRLAGRILSGIEPSGLGLLFMPVREIALKAVAQALNLGQLFLGMSFFLILSALTLTGMIYSFEMRQRSGEMGLLLAVGYRPALVRLILVLEGCIPAAIGSLAGALLGGVYTRALILALGSRWRDAVAGAVIEYHAEPSTALIGGLAGFVGAAAALTVAVARGSVRPARELLAGDLTPAGNARSRARAGKPGLIPPVAGLAAAAAIAALGPRDNPAVFFGAGALLLLSFLGLERQFLIALGSANGKLGVAMLGIRNAGRMRGRSLAAASILACGCFLVFAVSSMREDVAARAAERSSGTGGFALFGRTSIPILDRPGGPEGGGRFGLNRTAALRGVRIVPVKVRGGDDAGCLNLNRAQSPVLLGVNPDDFAERGAFVAPRRDGNPWELLKAPLPGGEVPGLAGDSETAAWGLGMKTGVKDGGTIAYRNETGGVFVVRLVGSLPVRLSVFHGSILIPAGTLSAAFPAGDGYEMFVADAPAGTEADAASALKKQFDRFGADVIPAVKRLKDFNAVRSAYMAMFLLLGGLGLLLGAGGAAVLALQNMRDRRAELAVLSAAGYSRRQVRAVVLAEHRLVLGMGLLAGTVSSLAAMLPNLFTPETRLPYALMMALLGGIALFYLAAILAAVRFAARRPIIFSLALDAENV